MKCASENRIISVFEPQTCQFAIVFGTPLVCTEEVVAEQDAIAARARVQAERDGN